MVDKGKPEEVASLQGWLTGVRFYTVAEVAGGCGSPRCRCTG